MRRRHVGHLPVLIQLLPHGNDLELLALFYLDQARFHGGPVCPCMRVSAPASEQANLSPMPMHAPEIRIGEELGLVLLLLFVLA